VAHPLLWRLVSHAACAQLLQELIRRHEERALVEEAANDDHRMGAHDVNDKTPAKLGEIVGSDDRIMVAQPPIVGLSLVLQESSHTGVCFQGPFHMGDKPRA
jgi:hypothetical protein